MCKVKNYSIAIGIMIVVSIVSLFLVSMCTYVFKWQADKAMIGIIITYVLVGFTGGFIMRRLTRKLCGNVDIIRGKMIKALLLSSIFMSFLLVVSIWGFQIPFELSNRLLLIWLLVACSVFGGMCVVKK